MTMYNFLDLVVGFLTLGVLSWTLWILQKYASDTKTLALTAVEQLPRPCVVVRRSPDHSMMAIINNTTVSLDDQEKLIFQNVGIGTAVNVRLHIAGGEDGEVSYQLPEMGPAESFASGISRSSLPEPAVVVIEFESIAGSRYRTKSTIEDQKWVESVEFEATTLPTRLQS